MILEVSEIIGNTSNLLFQGKPSMQENAMVTYFDPMMAAIHGKT